MARPDAELITLSQQGDQQAFAELVGRYQKTVYTMAVRLLGNREEGRDVAQEAFLRVYKSLPSFRKDADFLPWLYTITANVARDHWRRWEREKEAVSAPFDDTTVAAEDLSSPESVLETKDTKKMVEEAVASLPWEYRVPIVLRHIQDLSYKEIAEMMKLPLNTVKTRIRRGRLMLREILSPLLEQRSDKE